MNDWYDTLKFNSYIKTIPESIPLKATVYEGTIKYSTPKIPVYNFGKREKV